MDSSPLNVSLPGLPLYGGVGVNLAMALSFKFCIVEYFGEVGELGASIIWTLSSKDILRLDFWIGAVGFLPTAVAGLGEPGNLPIVPLIPDGGRLVNFGACMGLETGDTW